MLEEFIGPDVGDLVLLVYLEPALQGMQLWDTSDQVPASGGFVHTVVEAEAQEEVAAADTLLCQVALCDASLANHALPPLLGGTVVSVPVRVEVELCI